MLKPYFDGTNCHEKKNLFDNLTFYSIKLCCSAAKILIIFFLRDIVYKHVFKESKYLLLLSNTRKTRGSLWVYVISGGYGEWTVSLYCNVYADNVNICNSTSLTKTVLVRTTQYQSIWTRPTGNYTSQNCFTK
jgi:hypothetical protein